jgi:hypothetical protein
VLYRPSARTVRAQRGICNCVTSNELFFSYPLLWPCFRYSTVHAPYSVGTQDGADTTVSRDPPHWCVCVCVCVFFRVEMTFWSEVGLFACDFALRQACRKMSGKINLCVWNDPVRHVAAPMGSHVHIPYWRWMGRGSIISGVAGGKGRVFAHLAARGAPRNPFRLAPSRHWP